MICPKCGTENKGNCCIRCGTMLNGNDIIQIKDTRVVGNSIHDDLVLFIGDKAELILNKKINIFAAIFSILWFVYRKSYLVATILLLVETLIILSVSLLIPNIPIYVVFILFSIFYLFFANTLYIADSSRKIRNVKRKNTAYFNKLRKKGGTSIIGVILFNIILIAIISTMLFILKPYLKNVHKVYNLFFYTPNWEYDEITSSYRKNNCYAQIGELNEQGKILLENYYGIKEDFSNLEKNKILGNVWYTNNEEHRKTYSTQFYLINKKGKKYIAKFFTMDSISFDSCSKEFDSIKKTLFIK